MELGMLRGWITAITFFCFLGICWWAYRSANRQRFEEDARIPFQDDALAGRAPEEARGDER